MFQLPAISVFKLWDWNISVQSFRVNFFTIQDWIIIQISDAIDYSLKHVNSHQGHRFLEFLASTRMDILYEACRHVEDTVKQVDVFNFCVTVIGKQLDEIVKDQADSFLFYSDLTYKILVFALNFNLIDFVWSCWRECWHEGTHGWLATTMLWPIWLKTLSIRGILVRAHVPIHGSNVSFCWWRAAGSFKVGVRFFTFYAFKLIIIMGRYI
jgi:hypothetical protein